MPAATTPAPKPSDFPMPPVSSWLTGHRPDLERDQIGCFFRWRAQLGDIFRLRIGPYRVWALSDPAHIGEVLTTRGSAFVKDMGLRRAKVLLGEGLLTSEGAEHDRRSRLSQPFFRHKEVERYASAMVDVADRVVSGWRDGAEIDLAAEMSRLALGIVARALFGADVLASAPHVGAALTEILELLERRFWTFVPLPLWVPVPENLRFKRARAVLDDVVYRMIRERRRALAAGAAAPNDLLSSLLGARDEGGGGLDDEQLRDEVMTLFLAGHETTANGLSFAFWLLAKHPEAAARLRDEVDGALGGRPPGAADVARLPYTTQVFAETLRLYPPAWILGREAAEDVLIGGRVPVARGDMVLLPTFHVHRDPRWFPDPLAFRPERFAHDAPRPVPHSYIPFGGGKRACIGRSFALLEAAMLIPAIVQRVELEIDTREEVKLLPQITLRPAGGVRARVRVRVGAGAPARAG